MSASKSFFLAAAFPTMMAVLVSAAVDPPLSHHRPTITRGIYQDSSCTQLLDIINGNGTNPATYPADGSCVDTSSSFTEYMSSSTQYTCDEISVTWTQFVDVNGFNAHSQCTGGTGAKIPPLTEMIGRCLKMSSGPSGLSVYIKMTDCTTAVSTTTAPPTPTNGSEGRGVLLPLSLTIFVACGVIANAAAAFFFVRRFRQQRRQQSSTVVKTAAAAPTGATCTAHVQFLQAYVQFLQADDVGQLFHPNEFGTI